VAAVWRLLLHGLVARLCSLAVGLAGAGARTSVGSMEAAVRGRERRQGRSVKLLRFQLIQGACDWPICGMCRHVETRAYGRAATAVVWEALEVERVVCGRLMGSARPWEGTECAHVVVDTMDSQLTVRPVCIYSLWLPTSPAQARTVIPMHPPHTSIASVHGSDRYMVYHESTQLIFDFRLSLKSSVFAASVDPFAGLESTQGSYHTD
jgi:hypothetical protein